MSDTQAKARPSKAARELAGDIADLLPRGFPDNRTFMEAQRLIQSALSDLLEKAEAFRARHYNSIGASPLKSALEPWKPGE